MTAPVIIDLIALAVLFGFVLWGAQRGLVRALAGLLVFVISLVGANVIAEALTAPAVKLVSPVIERHIEAQVEAAVREQLPEHAPMPSGLEDLLDLLGLDEKRREDLGAKAEETIRETGATAAAAVVENLSRSFLHGLLYMISFTLLTTALHVFLRAMNLAAKLPVIHQLNAFGGGALGLLEGTLLLFVLAWLVKVLGLFPDVQAESHVFRFFMSHSPLDALLSL